MSKIWIAYSKCGCITAASIVDQDQKKLAQDIGEWILEGKSVASWDCGTVTLGHSSDCPNLKQPKEGKNA
jgi:hypothetical protein